MIIITLCSWLRVALEKNSEKSLCNCSVIRNDINVFILVSHCGQFSQKLAHSLVLTIVHSESISEGTEHITLT